MNSDVQKGSDSVKIQFSRVIKDFSQYLFFQKNHGNRLLTISKESESLMENWGETSQIQEPFFFQGSENADIFIIDSGTDFFKGKSGELLGKILAAMNLTSDSVFICNAGNLKIVNEKIKNIAPKVIITLGAKAGQFLLKIEQPMEKFQGRFHEYHGIKVMPTFHPSLLLKHKEYKRQVWEGMKQVMEYTGIRYGA